MIEDKVAIFLDYNILSPETVRAYRADLCQFSGYFEGLELDSLTDSDFSGYRDYLLRLYKPATVNRKLASVRSFLIFNNITIPDGLQNIPVRVRRKKKTDPSVGKKLLDVAYMDMSSAKTRYQMRTALRDAAVMSLLFSSGIRSGLLCSLRRENIEICSGVIVLHTEKKGTVWAGKDILDGIMEKYMNEFLPEIQDSGYLFVNSKGNRFSGQDVRRVLKKYSSECGIKELLSPRCFMK